MLIGAHVSPAAGPAKAVEVPPAITRAGAVIKEALAESESCALHLENTAGAGGTLGRSFDELAALFEAAGAGEQPEQIELAVQLHERGVKARG